MKVKDKDMSWAEVRKELSRTGARYSHIAKGLVPTLLAEAGVSLGTHQIQTPTSIFACDLPRQNPPLLCEQSGLLNVVGHHFKKGICLARD